MGSIPDEFLDLFERRTIAHVATLMPDGSPQVTPVWVDYDAVADRLLVNTERHRQKTNNVENDPRVAVSTTDPDDPYRMLSVRGEVETITTEGAYDHIVDLSERYTGEAEYPGTIETERVILSIRPDRVTPSGE